MLKRTIMLLIAIVLIILAVTGFTLIPANAADNNSYTVQAKYYDALTIYYKINYPDGSFREFGEDAPVGVLKDSNGKVIMNQIYCVDPFAAFVDKLTSSEKTTQGPLVSNTYKEVYSIRGPLLTKNYIWAPYTKDGENWGSTTTYTKEGYTFAAPWTSSAGTQKKKDAVAWLILNGYRGDFRAHGGETSESQISLDRLNNMYRNTVGGYIDKSTALMATKYALWEILTSDMPEDTVAATSTMLKNVDPVWQQIFYNLSAALINDALKWYDGDARNGTGEIPLSKITSLHLDIRNNIDTITAPLNETGEYMYYGPLTVGASINNPSGTADKAPILEKVFLSVSDKISGAELPSISFVSRTTYTDLNRDALPGTNQSTQYISVSSKSGRGWESDEFYLKIPKDLISSGAVDINRLTVKAMAMATKVPVEGGTPAVLVYQYPDGHPNAGAQDWNAIQAYIGAAAQDAEIDLFAQTSLNTDAKSLGDIYIYKRIESGEALTQGDIEQEFTFQVYHSAMKPDAGDNTYPPSGAELLMNYQIEKVSPDGVVSNSTISDGIIKLKTGGKVGLKYLPANGYYWVVETNPEGTYRPHYSIPSFSMLTTVPKIECAIEGNNYWTTPFQINRDEKVHLAFVTYYNKVIDEEAELKAHIQIGKVAPTPLEIPSLQEFTFRIQVNDSGWKAYPLNENNFSLIGGSNTGGYIGDGSTGEFKLRALQQATIDVEPNYSYRVIENNPGGNWQTSYAAYKLTPCNDEACDAFIHYYNYNWHIESAIDTVELLTPQMREEDEKLGGGLISVESNSTFLYIFNNINNHDLTISKKVTGDAGDATKSDPDEMFAFKVTCIEPFTITGAPQIPQEPVAFSAGGGYITVDGVRIHTQPLEIWNAAGELLKPEEIADRIKTEQVMTQNAGKKIDCPCILRLKNGEKATIHGLSTWNYTVSEILEAGKYITTYSINGGTSQSSRETSKFPLTSDTTIIFENNKPTTKQSDDNDKPKKPTTTNDTAKPDEPDTGKTGGKNKTDDMKKTADTENPDDTGGSIEPEEQDQPEKSEDSNTGINDQNSPSGGLNPQTNDTNTPYPAIAMLILGSGCITGAEIYRRKKRKG
jgi:hypothetical protein